MADGCDKRRLLDDEMSRFEAEILGSPPGSSEDSSERQNTNTEDRNDDRPPSSSKSSVEAASPLPPPPRPPALGRTPGPLRPPPPPPNVGTGAPHQHGPSFRSHEQMSAGPRPLFNEHRQFGPGPMGPPRPNGPHHRPFHPNGGPPDSYGPNGPRPYGPGAPQYSNGRGPYRPMRPDGPYGPQRPPDFNMRGDNGAFMNRDLSGGPGRGPGPHGGPSIGPPPPPTFLPPQLMRPPTMRPPPPPPPVHLMRNPFPSSTSASPTSASLLPSVPPPPAPRVVYASQPTLFTEIVKPAEPAPAPAPPAPTGDASKDKDSPANKESGRKNKKQKTSNGPNLVQQVTTTVSIVKKSNAGTKLPPSEPPVIPPPVQQQQQQPPQGPRLKKERRPKKNLRYAGGAVWEDATLNEWDPDDYRMFAGDLGNDVTDELLTRTFNCYPSFVKAKVVRDKFTNKSKGYGFLSFREPDDYTRAMKEMNGRYVGSRPIKLRKSQWRDRNLDVIQKKNAEKQLLGLK